MGGRAAQDGSEVIIVPIRTGRGQNDRENWAAKMRRTRSERTTVGWMLKGRPRPALPCVVTLTRSAPSNGLDRDNLQGSLKAIRDAVADWIGVDDAREDIVEYRYHQRRGSWGVAIEILENNDE